MGPSGLHAQNDTRRDECSPRASPSSIGKHDLPSPKRSDLTKALHHARGVVFLFQTNRARRGERHMGGIAGAAVLLVAACAHEQELPTGFVTFVHSRTKLTAPSTTEGRLEQARFRR